MSGRERWWRSHNQSRCELADPDQSRCELADPTATVTVHNETEQKLPKTLTDATADAGDGAGIAAAVDAIAAGIADKATVVQATQDTAMQDTATLGTVARTATLGLLTRQDFVTFVQATQDTAMQGTVQTAGQAGDDAGTAKAIEGGAGDMAGQPRATKATNETAQAGDDRGTAKPAAHQVVGDLAGQPGTAKATDAKAVGDCNVGTTAGAEGDARAAKAAIETEQAGDDPGTANAVAHEVAGAAAGQPSMAKARDARAIGGCDVAMAVGADGDASTAMAARETAPDGDGPGTANAAADGIATDIAGKPRAAKMANSAACGAESGEPDDAQMDGEVEGLFEPLTQPDANGAEDAFWDDLSKAADAAGKGDSWKLQTGDLQRLSFTCDGCHEPGRDTLVSSGLGCCAVPCKKQRHHKTYT